MNSRSARMRNTTSGVVDPGFRRAGGAMLTLLRLPREPKLHARIPEPWLCHRYARFSDTLFLRCSVWNLARRMGRPSQGTPILPMQYPPKGQVTPADVAAAGTTISTRVHLFASQEIRGCSSPATGLVRTCLHIERENCDAQPLPGSTEKSARDRFYRRYVRAGRE